MNEQLTFLREAWRRIVENARQVKDIARWWACLLPASIFAMAVAVGLVVMISHASGYLEGYADARRKVDLLNAISKLQSTAQTGVMSVLYVPVALQFFHALVPAENPVRRPLVCGAMFAGCMGLLWQLLMLLVGAWDVNWLISFITAPIPAFVAGWSYALLARHPRLRGL